MSVRVLEHVVRRAGLAVRLTDLATGRAVRDSIIVTAWPASRPTLATSTTAVTAAGVAGFASLPGLRPYEDGSTPRDAWFTSPLTFAPVPFVVRVDDASGAHLRVTREVLAPSAAVVDIALPSSPGAATPSGSLVVVANVVDEAGQPARWAVVEVSVGGFVTGGVCDERGSVLIAVPRAVAPTGTGSAASGAVWRIAVSVRFRPQDQVIAAGARSDDPPTITSLFTQQPAHIADGGVFTSAVQRDLTAAGPLVLASPPLAPSVLVVRPTP